METNLQKKIKKKKKSVISLYILFLNPKLAKICAKNESFVIKFSHSYYFVLSNILLKPIENKIRDFFIYNLFLNKKLAKIRAKNEYFWPKLVSSRGERVL